ncbi:pilus assembly protein [Aliishimia ponticola]|uniref:Pilus assembly protein n=1 Tax=Aliishimia ponticola TaxID=2499833 RepID=A0A4S4N8Z4_9RHOB|nr:TadE/TadG family type IV pilus assembly protein [Aliishimia ponticola]THH35696.1 pilus assembly protein [Aliishimia ponticola]
MIQRLSQALRRFGRDEDGHMIVEFALVIPLIFTIFMTSVELGIYQVRQMFLDRGTDMTVRLVRLNTGADYTHAELKQMICEFSGFLDDCDDQLKLEMNPVDLRDFAGFDGAADCTDASEPVTPNRSFKHGIQHEMMLLRACYKFKPVFASTGLGYELKKHGDGAGMSKMVSVTAFVQEP